MTATPTRKLKVFLCHSSDDKPAVREIFQRLKVEGWIDPWLDEEKLYPGQNWDMAIEIAVEKSDAVIVFLSNNSVSQEGYVQKEIKKILDVADEKSEGTIFLIPLRINDCKVPRRLEKWHYVDSFPKDRKERAYKRLLFSLQSRAENLGVSISQNEQKGKTLNKKKLLYFIGGSILILFAIVYLIGKIFSSATPMRTDSMANVFAPSAQAEIVPTATFEPVFESTQQPPPTTIVTPSVTYTSSPLPPPTSTYTASPTLHPPLTPTATTSPITTIPLGGKILFTSGAAWNLPHTISSMGSDGRNIVQIFHGIDGDAGARFSPDGKQIVYTNTISNKNYIFVMNSDGSNARQIAETERWASPDWSPDGTRIAFTGPEQGIYIVNIDGSNLRQITFDFDLFPRWSHSGDKIAFQSLHTGDWDIFITDPDGQKIINITQNPGVADWLPDWSPDDQKIAFTQWSESYEDHIAIMNADGSNVQIITGNEHNEFPIWSPDGQKIVFSSNRGGQVRSVYIMDADGTNPQPIIETDSLPSDWR